jgi:hypothetical protein
MAEINDIQCCPNSSINVDRNVRIYRIRISFSWRSIGESHVEGSWPLMKSNGEKSASRF